MKYKLRILRCGVWMYPVISLSTGAGVALSQDYPSKPVRIISSEAGGTIDLVARQIAQRLATGLGQPVIVDNRAGNTTAVVVAKAAPDGYTLLFAADTVWIRPFLQSVQYDPVKDFSPIILTTSSTLVLVVHSSLPVKSVKELLALAKARPGQLNYSAAGAGVGPHLSAELFKSMAGVKIVRVFYKGAVPALTAVTSGEVEMTFATAGAMAPNVKAGKIRPLAVTSLEPSALAPELPTMAASGIPGYESISRQGLFAPSGTSATTINRLNAEIARILTSADVKERLLSTGVEAIGGSPQQFASTMASEMGRMGKLIKDADIKAE